MNIDIAFKNDRCTIQPLPEFEKYFQKLSGLKSRVDVWGREVYFDAPRLEAGHSEQADAPDGSVVFWYPGNKLCLFFGGTPISPVVHVGNIKHGKDILEKVGSGEKVLLEGSNG
ncbi:MAG: hypothetical protein KAR07_00220 [Spirochaetes bacterium]|nr:hypothetical protein [Spirochaetota bacterium]MCK5266569.1 hypothetical protein [Spirochaetota bacterium]